MVKIYRHILISIGVLLIFSCNSENNASAKIKYNGIDRTIHLLSTSNEINRNKVNILFYGQSIIGGLKSDILVDSLRKRFPFANIKSNNNAIGGFTLPSLIKTVKHDLFIENPDLIIFHGYDGIRDGLYDSLVRTIRSRLNSDVLLLDHHYVWDKPQSKLEIINKSHDFDSKEIKKIAEKYNCGFVNVRGQWKKHLDKNNIKPSQLMGNTIDPNVHPNEKGNKLLRAILLSKFKKDKTSGYDIQKDVLRDEILLEDNINEFEMSFKANSVLLETNRGYNKDVKIEVLINGKKPSEFKSNYTITRPSKGYKSWMPAVKSVSFGSVFPQEEEWKLKIYNIDRANKTFKYSLIGRLVGFDGEGSSQFDFNSNSGRISIKKDDWNFFEIEEITKTLTPDNFEIKFNVISLVKDTIMLQRRISKYVLYRGYENKDVSVKLKVIEGSPKLKKIHVSRPYIYD